ncbi:MAG: methyltransferase domain-containing protein [Ruminococcaceae bacterium]|nr:methyltransferase domain-containing protein [Oscillospiraceae bacterium]
MEFPSELRFAIEQLMSGQDIRKLTASAEEISKRYRSESGAGKHLVSTERDTLAYAAVRMPATFGAVSKALELTLEQYDADITTVLDVGAGTGAASHAAELLTGCESVTCLEREDGMISLGKQLMQARGITAEWIKQDISSTDITLHADMVVSSYCLNELTAAARKSAVLKLWESTDKLLLIVEPGTPEGFSQLREARKLLIEQGGHIAAPCPHNGECRLPEDDWCHFTARIARSKLHKQLKGGEVPYEDEKFCFLAVTREPCAGSARILRHPKIESGKITLRLCTDDGICDRIVTKKSPLFKAARKSDSGDSFPADG